MPRNAERFQAVRLHMWLGNGLGQEYPLLIVVIGPRRKLGLCLTGIDVEGLRVRFE